MRIVLGWFCVLVLICAGDGTTGPLVSMQRSHAIVTVDHTEVPGSLPLISHLLRTPVQVPGGYAMSMTAVVGVRQVKVSWTYIDGLPGLNSHLDSWLLDILNSAATPSGGRYHPVMALNATQSPHSTLTVSAQPVQAAGTVIVIGEEVSGMGPDGTASMSSATIYADMVSGEVHRAAELLKPEALSGLRARVAGVPTGIAAPAAQQPELLDIILAPSGELHVTTARRAGRSKFGHMETTIATGDSQKVLSDVGRKILGQLQAPDASRPAAAPALRHVNCDIVPCAALTYDDGPDAKTTPQLLAILKEKNVQATFFMTGSNATSNPAIARQIVEAGHAIGNHTFSHPYLTKLSPGGIRSEMDRTDAAIRAITGSAPSLMRPPLRGGRRCRADRRRQTPDPLGRRFPGLAKQEPGSVRAQSAQRNHPRHGGAHA